MLSPGHRKIELLTRHEVKQQTAALKTRLEAVYADHAAKGRLQSGATIKVAIAAMTDLARQTLADLNKQIFAIAPDPPAFQALSLAMHDLLAFFREHVGEAINMASGRQPRENNASIETAAFALFDELDSEIEAKLEILSFDYQGASNPSSSEAIEQTTKFRPKSRGRAPAEFWDEMWAAIATKLYCGGLIPKAQRDVEAAMIEWIEANGFEVAVSTVRKRARILWEAIEASD